MKKVNKTIKSKKNSIKASVDDIYENPYTEPRLISKEKENKIIGSRASTKPGLPIFNKYPNINSCDNISVFSTTNGQFDCRETINTCINAYWSYSLVRSVLEIMVELASGNIRLKGGSKSVNDFVLAWFDKIGLWSFTERWMRERWRSGSCFVWPINGKFTQDEQNKLNKVYGGTIKDIPVYYGILNPGGIVCNNYFDPRLKTYSKILSPFEIDKIKAMLKAGDLTDLSMFNPEEIKEVAAGKINYLTINPEQLLYFLYKNQDYECFGIPLVFQALKDIEYKLELKRLDLELARTTERAILHIAVGESANEYNKGKNVNPLIVQSLNDLFTNASIARTLVTDFTVKASWVIPDISQLLSSDKYKQVDLDIIQALNAVIFDKETFANASVKIGLFIERLREARKHFLKGFLQPEINKICSKLNAKKIPQAEFEDFLLKDEVSYAKIAQGLAQLGLITPDELFEAINTGELPSDPDKAFQNQQDYKVKRDLGYYQPLLGISPFMTQQQIEVSKDQVEVSKIAALNKPISTNSKGRPVGSKAPKTQTNPKPIGTSTAAFSMKALTDLMVKTTSLEEKVASKILASKKLKKVTPEIKAASKEIVLNLISHEPEKKWIKKLDKYIAANLDWSPEVQQEIDDIQIQYEATKWQAAHLRLCKTAAPE